MLYRFTYKPERLNFQTDVSPSGDVVTLTSFAVPGFSSLQPGVNVRGDFRTPNPWSYFKHTVEYLHGSYGRKNSAGSHRYVGVITDASGAVAFNTDPYRQRAYNEALSKLLGKISNNLNLAVSAAESGQTVKMLNLVKLYTSYVADMKRSFRRQVYAKMRSYKSRRSVKRALRNWQRGVKLRNPRYYQPRPIDNGLIQQTSSLAANGYLAFTYGLSPLVSDIYGIAENVVGWSREIAIAEGKATSSFKVNQRSVVAVEGRNHVGTCYRTGFVACTLKVRATARFDQDYQKWSSINPIAIAYELLPFSFVYDWIVDLGGYMENLEKSLVFASDFRDGYASFLEVNRCRTVYRSAFRASSTDFALDASGFDEQISFSRELLLSFPQPTFPRINPELGSRRLLAAASLLRQLVR